MSCCAAVTHTVVPQKKSVASLQHSKLDLLHLLCYFWSGVAFQQHHAWLGASPSLIPYSSHSRSLGPPRNPLNLFEPLEAFEPLWTPWRPLNLIEGHWRLRSPLNPLTRSARSHFSDSPLRVTVFSGIPNIPLIALQYHCVLGNRPSVIESTGRGSPHHYLLIYYTLATLSTKNEANFSPHNI